ncbi:EthD family reductase [Oleisolibacter albus]|uniref:EthD family reductase n=1 Tax=Oleisolibacter albus TaxID=2171757 RepID=UPI000DF2DA66|nr:EthD family reductase [Oleisolibacter albus]
MHRLLVLYGHPKDPDHFRRYYVETHVPLAMRLPGLRAGRYSFSPRALGGEPPYFCIFEGEFDSEDALMAALGSDIGRAVAGDVANYASGGATLLHFDAVEA